MAFYEIFFHSSLILFIFLFSYMLQVQNLNNIMAFPLENVLKSELRDSRLVSLDFITYGINEILI